MLHTFAKKTKVSSFKRKLSHLLLNVLLNFEVNKTQRKTQTVIVFVSC